MGLKVIGAHYQWLCQCHPCQIDQKDPDVPDMEGNTVEDGAHMKINLPVFKDEDTKDAVTYQSWRWDLTVSQHAGHKGLHPPAICHPVLTLLSW